MSAQLPPAPLTPVGPALGRFITTESVVLAVNVQLSKLPERGAATTAYSAISSAGGGFTLLSVVAAQGIDTNLAAPLGTGPNSSLARRQLAAARINTLTDVFVGDIGVAMVFVEDDGNNTTVRTPGVESEPTLAGLEAIELHPGDLVHISGTDLATPQSDVVVEWGSSLPDDVTMVLAISPAVQEVSTDVWAQLLPRADVVTMNIREAAYLSRFLDQSSPGTGIRHIMRPEAAVVRRLGVMGCEVQATRDADMVNIPSYQSYRVDTTGVGDTHVAAMCAGLLQGLDLVGACQRANAAAALMVARGSTPQAPTAAEIDGVIQRGTVL
ncbi:PfkB family carbohydrate kinase [Actinomyces sp. F1_1611]